MAVITRCLKRSKIKSGQVVFSSSQTWTVPRGVKKIDVFLLSGGGGPGGYYKYRSYYPPYADSYSYNGGVGGCGYTANHYNIDVVPLSQISVVVGLGGLAGRNGSKIIDGMNSLIQDDGLYYNTNGSPGGASSFGSLSIPGGNGGYRGVPENGWGGRGGNGGSGGPGGGFYGLGTTVPTGDFGTNGGNGTNGCFVENQFYSGYGGLGQGFSTKAFGTTQYASQGVARTPNSGMGGFTASSGGGDNAYAENGFSGVVIVRWAEQ